MQSANFQLWLQEFNFGSYKPILANTLMKKSNMNRISSGYLTTFAWKIHDNRIVLLCDAIIMYPCDMSLAWEGQLTKEKAALSCILLHSFLPPLSNSLS